MSLEIGQPEAVDVDLLDDAMDNQQSVPDDVEMNEGGEDEDMKMLDDGDEENNNNDQEMEEVVVADGDGDEPLLEEDMETRSDVPEHEKEHKQPPDDEPEVLEDEEEHKQPPNDEGGPEVVEVFDTEEGEGDTEEPAGVVEEPSSGVDRGTLESENEHVQVLSGNEQEDHFESLEVTGSVVVDEIETAEKQEQEPEIAEGGDDHQETDAVGTSQQRSGDKQPAEEAGSSGAQEQAENTQQQESAKEEAVDQLEDESAAEEVAEEAPEQTNETETKVAAAVNEDDNDNAETGDQATAAATSEVIEEEEGAIQLDFPIIVFRNDALYYLFDNDSKVLTDEPLEGLLHDTSHCETSIEALFSTLREVFDAKGDPLKIESELVFSFPQLGLVLSEDNCYAKDITLYDIVQVFLSLNDGTPEEQRPTHLEVELNEQQRFITTFNYLSDIIKEGKGFNDIEFEEHDDTEQGEDEEESAVDENGNNNVNEDDDNGNAHNAVDTGTSNGDVSTPQKTAQGDDGENEATTTNEHSPSKKRSRQEEDQVDELETPSIGDVLGDDDENSNTQQEQPVVKRSKPDQSTAATAGKNSI